MTWPINAREAAILMALERGDLCGHEIFETIRQQSRGKYVFLPGTGFTILKRLREKGLVVFSPGERPRPHNRRPYRVTKQGLAELIELRKLLEGPKDIRSAKMA